MATAQPHPISTRTRIGPRSSGTLMTPEEFDATPGSLWDARYRYELINGVLIVSPPVSEAEADPNDELGHLLRSHKETHPDGSVLDATMPERTVPTTTHRRRCDRAIWVRLGRLPEPRKDIPSIVVEFVSAARRDALRDYEQKRDEYLAGVCEYWIIDRFRRIMMVYRRGPFGPVHQIVAANQDYETELLPGFVLPLAQLLGRADQWKRTRPQRSRKPPAGESDG
jgi:Uma2 family endonuclease